MSDFEQLKVRRERRELDTQKAEIERQRNDVLRMRLSIDTYRKETEDDRSKLIKEKLELENYHSEVLRLQDDLHRREALLDKKQKETKELLAASERNLKESEDLYNDGMSLKRKFEIKLNRINEIASL